MENNIQTTERCLLGRPGPKSIKAKRLAKEKYKNALVSNNERRLPDRPAPQSIKAKRLAKEMKQVSTVTDNGSVPITAMNSDGTAFTIEPASTAATSTPSEGTLQEWNRTLPRLGGG